MKSLRIFLLLSTLYFCAEPTFSQKDTEFWFVAPETSQGSVNYDRPVVFRFSTYDLPATVTISQPANPSFIPQVIAMAANSASQLQFPPFFDLVENYPPDQVLNKGFLIEASNPITAYYEILGTSPNNPEIFSLKGRNALGTRFYIPFQNVADNTSTISPQPYAAFDIVAKENNTVVTMTPTMPIVGGAANIPKVITLNRGQTFSAQAIGLLGSEHPGGSEVVSNKPITITIKDDLLDGGALYGNFCRDLIGSQIVPVEKIGTKYVLQKGFLNGDEFAFVIATEQGTQISMDGVLKGVAGPGQTLNLTITSGRHFVESSKPVYVLQLTGIGCELAGEIMPALDCSGSSEVRFVRSTNEAFYLFLVTQNGHENGFTLNGNNSAISSSSFQVVPGSNGQYVSAVIPISTLLISAGQSAIIENSQGVFQMGFLNGGNTTGCRFGYFSDYGNQTLIPHKKTLCPNTPITINNIQYTQPTTVYDTIPGIQGCDTIHVYTISLAPVDLQVSIDDIRCVNGRVDLDYTVCNLGSDGVPQGTMIAIYNADPTQSPAAHLGNITLNTSGADSCHTGTLENAGTILGLTNGMPLYAVVNDNGSLPTPFTLDSFPVTDIEECNYANNFDSVLVLLPAGPVLDLGPTVILCQDSTIVFDAGPGFAAYLWQDGSNAQTLAASASGIYWVEVADSCGAIQRDSVLLTVSLLGDIKLADTSLCLGDSYTLNVPGFDSYAWSPAAGLSCTDCPNPSIQPITTTTYTLLATTTDGCVLADTFTVQILPPGAPLELGPTVILCKDSTVVFDAGPGYAAYLWQDGSSAQTFAASASGIYWVKVADSCGATQRDSVLLTVSLLADIKLADTSLCIGDSYTLTVSGFDSYAWSPAAGLSCTDCPSPTIQPTATTTYTLLATTDLGCFKTDTFTVDLLPLLTATDTIEFCPGDTVTIGGQSYSQPGIVIDTMPAPPGCDLVTTYVLKYVEAPNSSVSIECIESINIATLAGTGSVLVNYALPTYSSDCPCPGVTLTRTEGLASGSLFPVAKNRVCYEVRDSCGNRDTCCFFVIIREALPCDVKEIGCMRYELLRITQNSAKERSYRIRVINKCPDPMIYTVFELPPGVVAVAPADNSIYTSPDNRDYQVRNPNFTPFYSIRFKSIADSIANGESDIFEYTLPPQSAPDYIHVTARVFPQQFFEAYLNTFNCPVQPVQKPEFENQPALDLRVFPNPTSGVLYADLSFWVGENLQLRVLDATGKQLHQLQLTADSAPQEIRLSRNLPEGLYFLEMQTARGEQRAVRFVVQH